MTNRAPEKPIGWLGLTPFAFVTTLSSVSRTLRTSIVEHPIINGKPALEVMGDELTEVRMTVSLHETLCNVSTELAQLESMRAGHSATSLLWANGEVWGDFIITELAQDLTWLGEDGTPRSASVSVTLKELASMDVIQMAINTAQKNARGRQASAGHKLI